MDYDLSPVRYFVHPGRGGAARPGGYGAAMSLTPDTCALIVFAAYLAVMLILLLLYALAGLWRTRK